MIALIFIMNYFINMFFSIYMAFKYVVMAVRHIIYAVLPFERIIK
jgi:hypothetical protein